MAPASQFTGLLASPSTLLLLDGSQGLRSYSLFTSGGTLPHGILSVLFPSISLLPCVGSFCYHLLLSGNIIPYVKVPNLSLMHEHPLQELIPWLFLKDVLLITPCVCVNLS